MLTTTFVIKRDKHHSPQLAYMDTFILFSINCTTALLPNIMIQMETVRLYCLSRRIYNVNILLKNNVNVNLCNKERQSPFSIACQHGHFYIVNILLKNGAHFNQRNKQRFSSLYRACQNRYDEIVELLLQNDANVILGSGHFSLFIACQEGHCNIVKRLIEKGAVVDKCVKKGTIPLYVACQEGHTDIVKILLRNKADVYLGNERGYMPYPQNGHASTVSLLFIHNKHVDDR